FQEGDGFRDAAELDQRFPPVPAGVGLAAAVPDLTGDGQGLLVAAYGLGHLVQTVVGNAQVAQSVALAAAVADRASDGEGLLVAADGLLHRSEVVVGPAQAAQGVALPFGVADLSSGRGRDVQPGGLIARMLTQSADIPAAVRIPYAQPSEIDLALPPPGNP